MPLFPANQHCRQLLLLLLLPLVPLLPLCSCSTAKRALDAKPTRLSSFIDEPGNMRTQRSGPFQQVWTSSPREWMMQSSTRNEIFIAPVKTGLLRPVSQKLSEMEMQQFGKERPVEQLATELHSAFVSAFQDNPSADYRVVDKPTANSISLELCLLELNPTSVTGNLAKKAATFVVGPAAGLAGRWTKGSVAIEGKLRDSPTNWMLFQFADREQDKMTFWTLRDFKPYGHCRVAFREWAEQFEKLTRTSNWRQNIKDASIFTLNPL
jgi:hypothetical protein